MNTGPHHNRETDVLVVGRVVEILKWASAYDSAVYHVEVDDQEGDHKSGTRTHVSARMIEARPTRRMVEGGIHLRVGDRVGVLVNPVPNRHVCAIVRLVQHGGR